MMTKNKCRSKNPSACPFHGSPAKSINTMLMNKDISEYMEYRANIDDKVKTAQVELDAAKFRLAQVEIEIKANKIREEMSSSGRKQYNSQELMVIGKTELATVAAEKRTAALRLGGATNRDDADFEGFLNTQSGNSKIQDADEAMQVKIFRKQIDTLEEPQGRTFSNEELYEEHHKLNEDIRKAERKVASEIKLRDEAIGIPSIPVTEGYKALQKYLPRKEQKVFENYNTNLNKIAISKTLSQSHKEEAIKELKSATLENLERALYKAECESNEVNRELITFPDTGKKKSYKEKISDAEHFIKTFKSAPDNAIFSN